MALVLIVDDVAAMAEQYAYDLNRLGKFETKTATGGKEALTLLEDELVDCIILDLEMPGLDGFGVLEGLRKKGIFVPVIVYTGTGNYDRCVRAIKLGAYSFIDKSEPMERVVNEVQNALEHGRLVQEVGRLRSRLQEDSPILGNSSPMQDLRESLGRLAPIPSPVLILGESGTGKELVARELHRGRKGGSFVALNSAALPENLVESELFGHEAGAFTGASKMRKGAFEEASGGTLFLDEIGELPLGAQAKLLRVLENHEVTRVGGSKVVNVNTRVVAATNRNLENEVQQGNFRQDLYFRLNVHTLTVAPLRERLEDIPELVEHFLGVSCRRLGIREKKIHPDALERLRAYSWSRNNVRELRNIIERMIIGSDNDLITADDVPQDLMTKSSLLALARRTGLLKELKAEAERQIVVAALERNTWHITDTAAELGLADHSSLLKIMRRHGLRKPTSVR
ncbi:MAG: sigma-54-dependent Fis family transcriptional regulator [Candidatus Eisenbacteria bacterium]|uniref:Sigma-54-dependent Fis family transcriptional regulator n=1 Tax=Eiseniibacteriota bacterium TaxID=2212470 RepID=A0A7Y2H2N7_UNCEI|nr:sigma-54-dependent Fis family transcriptional regulator [Candidatus Eisenbacteria bacterium]